MPLNISDVDNSWLEAQARVDDWAAQFLPEWYGPQLDMGKLELYAKITSDPLVVANLKQMGPAAWAQFEKEVKQIKERYANGRV